MSDILFQLVSRYRSRPLSIATCIAALFVPASLLIFVAKPRLFVALPLPSVLLLAVGMGLPIVILCYALFYTPLSSLYQRMQRAHRAASPEAPVEWTDQDDLLEWPCLMAGSWTAIVIQFALVAIAYLKPIRIGATMLLTALVIGAVWLLVLSVAVATTIGGAASTSSSEVDAPPQATV